MADGEKGGARSIVRRIRSLPVMIDALRIRIDVFVEEQAVPPLEELDAFDRTAAHWIALVDGEPVGTARLVDKGHGAGKIGRVAVLRAVRGRGVGAALMRAMERHAMQAGFEELLLDAQCHAIPFYERLGYEAEGGVFLDCGIEHRLMRKRLAPRPRRRRP